MRLISLYKIALSLTLLVGLSACALPPPPDPEPPRAPTLPAPVASAESRSAALYYRRIERDLVARGLMRTDGGGIDSRFDARTLAQNFERVALFNEYVRAGDRFVARQSAATLRRWDAPVRVKLHFGASAPAKMRAKDSATIARYLSRLSRATGHPVTLTQEAAAANFHLFLVSIDEQHALAPEISALDLGLAPATIADIARQGRNNYCFVYASSRATTPHIYQVAVAVVRTEHPDLMRRACYHEELAQGLGLANDSPEARPSIFNDDEEFALLTGHDELLLRMLYDPRLTPGMTPESARPIVAQIAREIMARRS